MEDTAKIPISDEEPSEQPEKLLRKPKKKRLQLLAGKLINLIGLGNEEPLKPQRSLPEQPAADEESPFAQVEVPVKTYEEPTSPDDVAATPEVDPDALDFDLHEGGTDLPNAETIVPLAVTENEERSEEKPVVRMPIHDDSMLPPGKRPSLSPDEQSVERTAEDEKVNLEKAEPPKTKQRTSRVLAPTTAPPASDAETKAPPREPLQADTKQAPAAEVAALEAKLKKHESKLTKLEQRTEKLKTQSVTEKLEQERTVDIERKRAAKAADLHKRGVKQHIHEPIPRAVAPKSTEVADKAETTEPPKRPVSTPERPPLKPVFRPMELKTPGWANPLHPTPPKIETVADTTPPGPQVSVEPLVPVAALDAKRKHTILKSVAVLVLLAVVVFWWVSH